MYMMSEPVKEPYIRMHNKNLETTQKMKKKTLFDGIESMMISFLPFVHSSTLNG